MEVGKRVQSASVRGEREREEGAPDHDQALPRHSKGAFPLGALVPPLPSGASMLTKCVGGWRGEESRVRGKEMGGKMAGGFGRAEDTAKSASRCNI